MHCIFEVCVANVCGDGVKADAEACDDGNQRNGDGCDARCQTEAAPGCGNGVVEPREQCDDGNTMDNDQCTHLCTKARCGDRIVSLGEDCDDGNLNDSDGCSNQCRMRSLAAGSGSGGTGGHGGASSTSTPKAGMTAPPPTAGMPVTPTAGMPVTPTAGVTGAPQAGAAGSRAGAGGQLAAGASGSAGVASAGMGGSQGGAGASGGVSAACTACREANCRNYQGSGVDMLHGCLEAVDASQGADPSDATFIMACTALLQCAHANKCAFGADGPNACYCGTATADNCIANGPAADAPCVQQFKTAARVDPSATPAEQNNQVTGRVSDLKYPAAWGSFLLQCERESCLVECGAM